jgi:hypothetical protein
LEEKELELNRKIFLYFSQKFTPEEKSEKPTSTPTVTLLGLWDLQRGPGASSPSLLSAINSLFHI